ncbi:MAG: response regulator [Magnetococcales bacterium]|nr:response regulator [Magnetococcales bacterium]MBF0155347.1 response regulator [Magnetococcales bacterium]
MKKILIVDDDPHFCLVLETRLIEAGYETHVAENGQKGVSLVRTWHPDLVIMDLDMPVMDGVRAIKEIKRGGYSGKIVVMTGNPGGGNVVKAHLAGARHIIAKPYQGSPVELVESILNSTVE